MNIGEYIKKYRKEKGLTQKQLAKAIDVSTITIQNYENNRRRPNINMLKIISEKLNVPIGEFLKDELNENRTAKIVQDTHKNMMEQVSNKLNENRTYIDLKLYDLSHWDSAVLFDTIIKYMENTKNYELSLDYSLIDEINEIDTKNNKNLITTTEINELINKICEFMEFEIFKLEKQKLLNNE